jgi:2,5-diketo-D-gluconate reductase A
MYSSTEADLTRFGQLNDGRAIPRLGLGTWKVTDQESLDKMIGAAMEAGYRHFDCAEMYENEEKIGIALEKALKACGV